MRFSRLFQRAGAIGAASVALVVSSFVYANTAPSVTTYTAKNVTNAGAYYEADYYYKRSFSANDPTYPGKTDYVKRHLKVEKAGNPMKWVKRTGLEVAVLAAVAAAGYAIDELTNQVMRPVWIPDPDALYYQEGYFWYWRINSTNYYGATIQEAAEQAGWNINESAGGCVLLNGGPNMYCQLLHDNSYSTRSDSFTRGTCPSGSTESYCQPVLVQDFEPVPDSEVWDIVNPVADAHPEWLQDWVFDPNGNPYIYPEVAAAQDALVNDVNEPVTGAATYPEAVIVSDPLAGQGLDPTGQPTGNPSPTPSVSVSVAPIEFPTDYAREDSLQEIRDALKNETLEDIDVTDDLYQPLIDSIELPAPPNMPVIPDFGIQSGGGCDTITFSWRGSQVVFPSSSQCAKLQTGQTIIGWFLYVVTFFGCVYTILGAKKGAPA